MSFVSFKFLDNVRMKIVLHWSDRLPKNLHKNPGLYLSSNVKQRNNHKSFNFFILNLATANEENWN